MNEYIHPFESKESSFKVIDPDIKAIEEAIKSDNEKKMKTAHMKMYGKYSTYALNVGSTDTVSFIDLILIIWKRILTS